ncbi:MAG: preprotein translocase subunit SecG [Crocinitomicaceae bacterium]
MIFLGILAIAVIVLILIQSPTGNSKVIMDQTGAKNNRSFLTKATLVAVAALVVLTLALY